MSANQPENTSQPPRTQQIRQIVDNVIERRAAGESITDQQVMEQHPHLMPELGEALVALKLVERAHQAARSSDSAPTLDDPGMSLTGSAARIQIKGYTLVREISRGGQAVVFLGVKNNTGRKVAIKVMREGPLADDRGRARFDREVQILGALNHPHIVPVVDRGETEDGSHYFAMEYVSGRPLDHFLQDQSTRSEQEQADSMGEMLRLFVKIADAVNVAHLRGIVHRDLKPSNILIDERGEPRLLDFGLAHSPLPTHHDQPQLVTVTGQFIGSLPWASPEQAEGVAGKIDTRSDVYSLGVILYQMLTGKFPYEVVGNMRDVLNNILTAQPTPPTQVLAAQDARAHHRKRRLRGRMAPINEEIEAIVLKALSKARDNRYQTAGEFSRDVAAYLSGQPTLAGGLRAQRRRAHSARRRTLIAASCCVLLGAVGAFIYLNRTRPTRPTAHVPATSTAVATTTVPASTTTAQPSNTFPPDILDLKGMNLEKTFLPLGINEKTPEGLGGIVPLAISPGGTRILTTHPSDTSLLLLQFPSGQELRRLVGHTERPLMMALSPDGRWGASAAFSTSDKSVRIWDLSAGKLHLQLKNTHRVRGITFSPDSRHLLAIAFSSEQVPAPDEATCVWDVQSGQIVRSIPSPRAWRGKFTADGSAVAVVSGNNSADDMLRLIDLKGGKPERILTLPPAKQDGQKIDDFDFSPDGRWIALSVFISFTNHRGSVQLYETDQLREVRRVSCASAPSVKFSPDSTRVVAGAIDGHLFWDVAAGHVSRHPTGLEHKHLLSWAGQSPYVLNWGRDGKKVKAIPAPGVIDSARARVPTLKDPDSPASLTAEEIAQRWTVLTMDHWQKRDGNWQFFPNLNYLKGEPGWSTPTRDLYQDFELAIDWCALPGSTGSIFFRVPPDAKAPHKVAAQFRLADNSAQTEGPTGLAGSLLGLFPATADPTLPAGWYNTARLVVRGNQVEHWLNDQKVLDYQIDSPAWQNALKQSTTSPTDVDFARATSGHIVLRVQSGTIYFRNARIRPLNGAAATTRPATTRSSSLAQLRAEDIPPHERFEWQPKQLVAVLGSHRFRHWGGVTGVACTPDDKQIISAGGDDRVCIWDAATGNELFSLPGSNMAVTPDGQRLISASRRGAGVTLWDMKARRQTHQLMKSGGDEIAVAMSADGTTAALATPGGEVTIWNARDGSKLASHRFEKRSYPRIALSGDGKEFIIPDNGRYRVCDSLKGVARLDLPGAPPANGWGGIAFSPNGKFIAAGNESLEVWNATTGEKVASAKIGRDVTGIAFDPNSSAVTVFGADDSKLFTLNIASNQLSSFHTAQSRHRYGAYSIDGQIIVTGGSDGAIRRWNAKDGAMLDQGLNRPELLSMPACSPDGCTFATQGDLFQNQTDPNARLHLWDVPSRTIRTTLLAGNSKTSAFHGISFAPNGTGLVTASSEGTQVRDPINGVIRAKFPAPGPYYSFSLALSPDGKRLARGKSMHKGLTLQQVAPPHQSVEIAEDSEITAVGFSPDGKWLLFGDMRGNTTLWDLANAKAVRTIETPGNWRVNSVALSPDSSRFATAIHKEIRVYDIKRNEPLVTYTTPAEANTAAFSADGRSIFSADNDGRILHWLSPLQSQEICRLPGYARLFAASDGQHLLTANFNGTIYVLRLDGSSSR